MERTRRTRPSSSTQTLPLILVPTVGVDRLAEITPGEGLGVFVFGLLLLMRPYLERIGKRLWRRGRWRWRMARSAWCPRCRRTRERPGSSPCESDDPGSGLPAPRGGSCLATRRVTDKQMHYLFALARRLGLPTTAITAAWWPYLPPEYRGCRPDPLIRLEGLIRGLARRDVSEIIAKLQRATVHQEGMRSNGGVR